MTAFLGATSVYLLNTSPNILVRAFARTKIHWIFFLIRLTHTWCITRPVFHDSRLRGKICLEQILAAVAARRVQYREVLHPKDMLNVFFYFPLALPGPPNIFVKYPCSSTCPALYE
jgi:hypothetical protein